MAADGDEGYPSWEDRIVAEFGDGLDVEGIAFRYGLTVTQVYAVIERAVGPANQHLPAAPGQNPPPVYYGPPGYYGPPPQAGPPGYYVNPPGQQYYGPPAYPMQPPPPPSAPAPGFSAEDAIVAEYGEGYDINWIAYRHGITVEQVYAVVQRAVADDPMPPGGPIPPS